MPTADPAIESMRGASASAPAKPVVTDDDFLDKALGAEPEIGDDIGDDLDGIDEVDAPDETPAPEPGDVGEDNVDADGEPVIAPDPRASKPLTKEQQVQVLRRDGVPMDVIGKLTDAQRATWAAGRKAHQAQQDAFASEFGELRKELKTLKDGSGQAPNPSATSATGDDAAPDPLDELETALGPEVSAPLRRYKETLMASVKQERARADDALVLAMAVTAELPLRMAYGAKAPDQRKVIDKMDSIALSAEGKGKTLPELAAAAYAALAGERPRADNRDSSQPTAPRRRASGAEPRSLSYEDALLVALERGLKGDAAARWARSHSS